MTLTKEVAGFLCAGKSILLCLCLCSAFALQGCARVESVVLGRVENRIEDHAVVVTDCYRIGEQSVETGEKSAGGVTYKYAPCRDAVIFIKRGELIVNNKSYGLLNQHDAVTVDHGKVLINEKEAAEIASK